MWTRIIPDYRIVISTSIALTGYMIVEFMATHLLLVVKEFDTHLLEPFVAYWTLGALALSVAVTPRQARPPSLTDEARGEVADQDRLKYLLVGYGLQPRSTVYMKTLNALPQLLSTCV